MSQSYIVRFKESVSDADYKKALDDVKSAGGSVKHEYTLFKGFTASLPEGHVSTLESHPHVDQVELDGAAKTQ